MNELFKDMPEVLSPKEQWKKDNNVTCFKVEEGFRATNTNTNRSATGEDEESAIAGLCVIDRTLKHWKDWRDE